MLRLASCLGSPQEEVTLQTYCLFTCFNPSRCRAHLCAVSVACPGMMTYVCISELLPSAYGETTVSRTVITSFFFLGCAVMALSIVIEKFATA